jgi:hypothetical protein
MKFTSILLVSVLLLCVQTFYCEATTTSTQTRNVNIADGFVESGNGNGLNASTGQWENDEKFTGFNGVINWFLTWDNNNLYIGKIGGNNSEGSLIYIRADYGNAQFTNTPQSYDDFTPNCSLMSGINFVAYLKPGGNYDEFRTFQQGAWSAPNTNLTPATTSQADGAHLELAIPWNSISNNNGRPNNIRIFFYQVAPNSSSCNAQNPNPFIYAESPWGTGVGNDGPNVGVNDGVATSAVQPGGCGNGQATITRWWGCYPVISGVGANGFVAVAPNAGNNIEACITTAQVTMNANEPAADAIGTWSVASIPNNAAQPNIVNVNLKNTTINNLSTLGEYKFVWNINYGNCPATPDTVVVAVYQAPPPSVAGNDETLGCGINSIQLNGNEPTPQNNFQGAVGQWIQISGTGNIQQPNSASTQITNISLGTNKYVWQLSNGGCPVQKDTITITRFAPAIATVGNSTNTCNTSFTLTGNNPSSIQSTAQGVWSLVSGPSAVVFANAQLFNTTVSQLVQGTYILKWKVSTGNCPPDSTCKPKRNRTSWYKSKLMWCNTNNTQCIARNGSRCNRNMEKSRDKYCNNYQCKFTQYYCFKFK